MATRLFCDPLPSSDEPISLPDSAFAHARVLRLRAGDELELFDGQGSAIEAVVLSVQDALQVRASGTSYRIEVLRPSITLVQALPKQRKLDGIVRMCVEIGVDEIRLAHSSRTVPTWADSKIQGKIERLERVAQEAARQANQSALPTIVPPEPLLTIARQAPSSATRILFWEEAEVPLSQSLPSESTWLAIGPEGGISRDEAHTMQDCGWMQARMTAGILRVETAGPIALALIRDRLAHCVPAANED